MDVIGYGLSSNSRFFEGVRVYKRSLIGWIDGWMDEFGMVFERKEV